MRYDHLPSHDRAACELMQNIVRGLEGKLVPISEANRHHVGLTRARLAQASGVSRATLNQVLSGNIFPRLDTVARLCHTADVPLEVN